MVIQNYEAVMVDTSVWLAAFRGKFSEITERARQLLQDDLALTCGPVLFEIRRGLRAQEYKKTMDLMEALIFLPLADQDWEFAGNLDASLRARGITIPPMDALIAQVCLSNDVPIFTLDKHFETIKDLRIFRV
ncbi:MAG TPA: PIN domain-containing protein [Candidatus Kapabacteria bacterium]|nr:PIN domain-containing protein [Candidatus Kapabacteria bacterium]